jgi:hypothetical protein
MATQDPTILTFTASPVYQLVEDIDKRDALHWTN